MSTWYPPSLGYSVNSQATTNAALIKAGPSRLQGYYINNASAATKWVRFYNKATTPVPGTDIPVLVIAVPATLSKELALDEGYPFPLGIGISITAAAPVNDATAVADSDVQVAIEYV
jgi:hypothetical protein